MRPELVFRARLFSAALAFCAALGLAGRAGVEQARAGAREPQPAFAIRVLGAPVDDALAPVAAAHAIASAWGAEGLVLRCGERTLAEVPRGSIARIDEADLAGLITRARQPTNSEIKNKWDIEKKLNLFIDPLKEKGKLQKPI